MEKVRYTISSDSTLLDEQNHITEEVKQLLEAFYFDIGKGKKSMIKRLERTCKKYPKVPQFKNYLSKEYLAAGQSKKAKEINDRILEVHPDYLFGKLNKAHTYMEAGNTEKVPDILGETMELQALYPDRDEFHVDEVANFYATTIRYYLETGDKEQAETRLELLEEIAPDAEGTRFARNQFLLHNMEENISKNEQVWNHDQKIERTVKSREHRTATQTDKAPEFHHQEIHELYKYDIDIDEELLHNLLALPHETLIADLEAVIEDTINRFEYYQKKAEEHGWDEAKYSFSIHAVHLLATLESEESLPAVLDLLRQGDEFLDFWYMDALEDFFNAPVAVLATRQIGLLDDFLREPDNSYYARNIAVTALENIALWYPERKDEVVRYYEQWLHFLVDNYEDERIYDSNLLGFIIWSCINIQAEELLPLIKKLYEQDLVLINMLGDYSDVERDIKKDFQFPVQPFDMFKKYKQIRNSPLYNYQYKEDKPTTPSIPKAFNTLPTYVEPENDPFSDVGRNDPCPCGSGRKFKKCCME